MSKQKEASTNNVNYRDPSKLNKFQRFFYNYGKYHETDTNIWIHIICVPFISYTLGKILEYYAFNSWKMSFNPFYIIFLIWGPIYMYLDVWSGLVTTLQYPLLVMIPFNFSFFGLSHIQALWLIHAFAWIAQFIGHGVYEKRKPALLDNIFLVFNAPVFVNLEIMYMYFDYKKEEIDETKLYIDAEVQEYRTLNGIKIKQK